MLKRPLCQCTPVRVGPLFFRTQRGTFAFLCVRLLPIPFLRITPLHVLRSSCLRADAEQVNASDSLGRTALMYAVHQLALASSASASASVSTSASSGPRGSVLRELLARPRLEVNAASNGALYAHMRSNSPASSSLLDPSRARLYKYSDILRVQRALMSHNT